MVFVATIIADGTLSDSVLDEWVHRFDTDWAAGRVIGSSWIDAGFAADLTFDPEPGFGRDDCSRLAESLRDLAESIAQGSGGAALNCDVVVQPSEQREKRLIVADMDSTMITVECIDELADYAGIKGRIAEVTERAMLGELDFATALDARVALLKGLAATAIDACLAERVTIMPGARALVRTMTARGGHAILVSGGFTRFAGPVAAEIGFDRAIANTLNIAGDVLDGTVGRPIVDSATKEKTLKAALAEHGLDRSQSLAVGDGANDLAMIRVAGLGVAYHAKPVVAAAAAARIDHGDLRALLWAQGIPRREWVVDA